MNKLLCMLYGKTLHFPLSWWHHQMETFSALLALCAGNLPVAGAVNSPHKASDAELWCFLWSAAEQSFSTHWRRRWFETPSRSLWCHWNGSTTLQRSTYNSYIFFYFSSTRSGPKGLSRRHSACISLKEVITSRFRFLYSLFAKAQLVVNRQCLNWCWLPSSNGANGPQWVDVTKIQGSLSIRRKLFSQCVCLIVRND